MGFLIVPNLVTWLIVSDQFCWTNWQGRDKQGCHSFQGQGKVREFFKTSGKIFDIVKVSEKSGNSVFRSILHKFSSRFWNHFLLEKMKRMLQSKQSDQFDTLHLRHVVVVVSSFCCGCFLPNSFFLFLQKVERGWKWRENYGWPAKKAKVNVNMDCFSLIKGQWKLFKGQRKVREFLTFW